MPGESTLRLCSITTKLSGKAGLAQDPLRITSPAVPLALYSAGNQPWLGWGRTKMLREPGVVQTRLLPTDTAGIASRDGWPRSFGRTWMPPALSPTHRRAPKYSTGEWRHHLGNTNLQNLSQPLRKCLYESRHNP